MKLDIFYVLFVGYCVRVSDGGKEKVHIKIHVPSLTHSTAVDHLENGDHQGHESKKHVVIHKHTHKHHHKHDHGHKHKHKHGHKGKHSHKHSHKGGFKHKHKGEHKHGHKHAHKGEHKHGHKHKGHIKHSHKGSAKHSHKHHGKHGHKHHHDHKGKFGHHHKGKISHKHKHTKKSKGHHFSLDGSYDRSLETVHPQVYDSYNPEAYPQTGYAQQYYAQDDVEAVGATKKGEDDDYPFVDDVDKLDGDTDHEDLDEDDKVSDELKSYAEYGDAAESIDGSYDVSPPVESTHSVVSPNANYQFNEGELDTYLNQFAGQIVQPSLKNEQKVPAPAQIGVEIAPQLVKVR